MGKKMQVLRKKSLLSLLDVLPFLQSYGISSLLIETTGNYTSHVKEFFREPQCHFLSWTVTWACNEQGTRYQKLMMCEVAATANRGQHFLWSFNSQNGRITSLPLDACYCNSIVCWTNVGVIKIMLSIYHVEIDPISPLQ